MVDQKEIESYLNKILNVKEYKDYGPNGLQIEGKNNIKKILFSVSCDLATINYAIKIKADALIVHHGIFWDYQGARPIKGPHGKRIKLLIENQINLFAYHLPLDGSIKYGNAFGLAKAIKLLKLEPFGRSKGGPNAFIGIKGHFIKAITSKTLIKTLEKVLDRKIIHARPISDKKIKSIGIITGGAQNEWPEALNNNLDAYITGEISEYNYHDSIEADLHFFACGHHATEKFGVLLLEKHLKNKYKKNKIQTYFFDSKNPV